MKSIKGTEGELSRIREGVLAIKETMEHIIIGDRVVENAINMYRMGHRDIIDNLLYSIAVIKGFKLLTVDKEPMKFIEGHNLAKENIIIPEGLK